jgi:hypothetical protein
MSRADWHERGPAELDESTCDALIDGCVSPADAPTDCAEVAQLINVIRGDLEAAESLGESRTVEAMLDQINWQPCIVSLERGGVRRRKKRSAAAAATVVGVFFSAGTAAAATGALPSAIQAAVHRMAADIGILIPSPGASAVGAAQTCRQSAQTGIAVSQPSVVSILKPCGVPGGLDLGHAAAASTGRGWPGGGQAALDRRQPAAKGQHPKSPLPTSNVLAFDFASDSAGSTPTTAAATGGGRFEGSGSGHRGATNGIANSPAPTARSAGSGVRSTTPRRGTGSQGPSGKQIGSGRTPHPITVRGHAVPRSNRPRAPGSKPGPPASTSRARPQRPWAGAASADGHGGS